MRPEEIREYCDQHASEIYVRVNVNGKWTDCSLKSLPPALADEYVEQFVAERRLPHRVVKSDAD